MELCKVKLKAASSSHSSAVLSHLPSLLLRLVSVSVIIVRSAFIVRKYGRATNYRTIRKGRGARDKPTWVECATLIGRKGRHVMRACHVIEFGTSCARYCTGFYCTNLVNYFYNLWSVSTEKEGYGLRVYRADGCLSISRYRSGTGSISQAISRVSL